MSCCRPLLFLLLTGILWGVLPARLPAQTAPALTLLETDEEEIDTALEDKQPGDATQQVYLPSSASPETMTSNSFIRNKGIWIGPKVDLSAISAYSDRPGSFGTKFAITAISPMHCLAAAHVAPTIGSHFNFVGSDNVTVMRTVVATLNPVDDVDVVLLNQPLPPAVHPMAILPRNWSQYLRVSTDLDMPALFINQHSKLYLAEVAGITPGGNPLVVCHFPSGFVPATVQHADHLRGQLVSGNGVGSRPTRNSFALAFWRLRDGATGSGALRCDQCRDEEALPPIRLAREIPTAAGGPARRGEDLGRGFWRN